MVRIPLTPEQVEAGRRLGALLRDARAGRDPELIARTAGISPETLRKIEAGRMVLALGATDLREAITGAVADTAGDARGARLAG